jgi:hypothetical protein
MLAQVWFIPSITFPVDIQSEWSQRKPNLIKKPERYRDGGPGEGERAIFK